MQSITLGKNSLPELQKHLSEIYKERVDIAHKIRRAQISLYFLKPASMLFGSFQPGLRERATATTQSSIQLERQLEDLILQVIPSDTGDAKKWKDFSKTFEKLWQSTRIWRVLGTTHIDKADERTPADLARRRQEIRYAHKIIPFIKCTQEPISLLLKDETEIYMYSAFSIIIESETITVCSTNEIIVNMDIIDYIEDENIASDTESVRSTWEKANVDGTKDKRYATNEQIPIVLYGLLTIVLPSQKKERLLFSNTKSSQAVAEALTTRNM